MSIPGFYAPARLGYVEQDDTPQAHDRTVDEWRATLNDTTALMAQHGIKGRYTIRVQAGSTMLPALLKAAVGTRVIVQTLDGHGFVSQMWTEVLGLMRPLSPNQLKGYLWWYGESAGQWRTAYAMQAAGVARQRCANTAWMLYRRGLLHFREDASGAQFRYGAEV